MMRVRLLFLLFMIFCWVAPVQARLTFGVVPKATHFFPSLEEAQVLADYLSRRLGEEVEVREFQEVTDLHEWLNRYRTVDMAAFTVSYVRQQQAGEFEVLATVVPLSAASGQSTELVVARQGVRRGLRNRLELALTAMGGDPEGRQLLAASGISHLVGAKVSPPDAVVAAFPQEEALPLAEGPAVPSRSLPPIETSLPAPATLVMPVTAPLVAIPALVHTPAPEPEALRESVAAESSEEALAASTVTEDLSRAEDVVIAEGEPVGETVIDAPEAPAPVAISQKPAAVSSTGPGLQDLSGPAPVNLEADELSYDREASLYTARGGVRLTKGGVTLDADQMLFNDLTGDADATGNVYLTDPSGSLRAEQADYNMETGVGRIRSGKVFIKEHNFHLAGDELKRIGEQDYQLERGFFTTCDGDVPSWKFGARHIDVTLGKYARASNVLFYLHDWPVFYLPYIVFPAKTERESGMLMPRFGYSDKRGAELSLAYYQVIARNQDATIYVDYLSDFGIGQGVEYRYIFGADNEGTLRGYYVNNIRDEYLRDKLKDEPDLADTLDEDDRYAMEWTHLGTLPGDWTLSADVEYVSNRDYFDEFGTVAEEYTKDQSESVVYLSRTLGNNILAMELDYTQDLAIDDDTTLQRLPEVRFDALRRRLWETPFFFDMASTYTYFWRKEEKLVADDPSLAYDRVSGHRLNVRPALSMPLNPFPWLEVVPEVGYRERLYETSSAGPGFEEKGIYDFSMRLGSSFSRVFQGGLGSYRKIRHSIDPEVFYSYVPGLSQDHLPYFDGLDRVQATNRVTYSLTNRFTARVEPQPGVVDHLEFLSFRVSQGYDIRQSRHDRENVDGRDPLSDIRGELLWSPTRSSFVDFDTRYDFHTRTLDSFNIRTGLRDSGGNSLSADYRYTRENSEYISELTDYEGEGTEYVGGSMTTALLAPFYFGYQHRYDLQQRTSLEKVFDLEYRSQCWSLFLTLRDRIDERQYVLVFALSGIGNVLRMGGNLGSTQVDEE